jgi:hypothetical protein
VSSHFLIASVALALRLPRSRCLDTRGILRDARALCTAVGGEDLTGAPD